MKSLRTKLNAEVDVVSVPNGAYRSFTETLSSVVKQVVRKQVSCVLLFVGILVMQVTDVDGVDKVTVKVSGDGAKLSSSSSFLLLTFSLYTRDIRECPFKCRYVYMYIYV